METKKSPGLMAKVRRKRWTKDDTELTLLSLPTLLWYLIFSYKHKKNRNTHTTQYSIMKHCLKMVLIIEYYRTKRCVVTDDF